MAYTTIDDPSKHFQTTLYTGNGSANLAITNGGNSDLQPDLVWIKNRAATDSHCLFDSTRGATEVLHCDTNAAEATDADTLDSFASDGFQVDADVKVNTNTETYVAWQWKCNGGTTSSNTDGSTTSTVQANTTAGFSIATYGGNGTDGATFGHGLGAVPHFITIKTTSGAGNWMTYHQGMGADKAMFLDLDIAIESSSFYQETPTSTIITLNEHGNVNGSGKTHLAYLFAPIQGFSKFGEYTGNGDSDGPFVYTGFRVAWLMIKRTDSANNWAIYDFKRDPNGNDKLLFADGNDATDTASETDLLSNGFKMRSTSVRHNADGGTYVYAAFAENPFVTSGGVPCTAR